MKKKVVFAIMLFLALGVFLVVGVMADWRNYQEEIIIGSESLIYDFIESNPNVELIADSEHLIDKSETSEDGFKNGNGFLYWNTIRSEEIEPLVNCMFQEGDARYHWMMYRYESTEDAKDKFWRFTHLHYANISKPPVTWGEENKTEFASFYPYGVIINRGFVQTWYCGTDFYVLLSETDEDGFAMKQQIKEYMEDR